MSASVVLSLIVSNISSGHTFLLIQRYLRVLTLVSQSSQRSALFNSAVLCKKVGDKRLDALKMYLSIFWLH